MIIGDIYLYDLTGTRVMDSGVPYPGGVIEPDEFRVWCATTGPRCVLIQAGSKVQEWAHRLHIAVTDTQESWDALAAALAANPGAR